MNFFLKFLLNINNNVYILSIRKSFLRILPLIIINTFLILIFNLLVVTKQIDYSSIIYVALVKLFTTINSVTPYFIIFLFSQNLHHAKEGKYNLRLSFLGIVTYLLLSNFLNETDLVTSRPMNFRAIIVGIFNYKLYETIKNIIAKISNYKTSAVISSSYISETLVILAIHLLTITFIFAMLTRAYPIMHFDLSKGFTFNNSLKSPLLYNFIILIPWLLGVNGSQLVVSSYLQLHQNSANNINSLLNGIGSLNIIDESFFNLYINIGGSGSTLCLIFAILLVGRKNSKRFIKFAILPSLFNINEIIIYGLPIIGNFYLIIPFVLVPTIFTVLSFYALKLQIIPVASTFTSWLSPVLLSGFMSNNGNIRVVIWQLFLLIVGTIIYAFFFKKYEKICSKSLIPKKEINFITKTPSYFDVGNAHFDSILSIGEAKKKLSELLEDGKLILFFQPIVNIKINQVKKLEALIRIEHKKLGIVPPYFLNYFITLDKISELDYWVIEECFKYEDSLKENNLSLSINISANTFIRESFYNSITTLARNHQINPSNYTLELVEEICLNDLKNVKNKIIRLQEFGFKVAIDDFGTGYSSLSYLFDLPADYIKIDKSFVQNLKYNKGVQIFKNIVNLCHSINCKVIVEGVETKEELNIIKGLNVDMIQGYYFFKPNSFDSIIHSIKKKF